MLIAISWPSVKNIQNNHQSISQDQDNNPTNRHHQKVEVAPGCTGTVLESYEVIVYEVCYIYGLCI